MLWITTVSGQRDHARETPSVLLPGAQEFSQGEEVEAGLQVAQRHRTPLPWLSAPSAAWAEHPSCPPRPRASRGALLPKRQACRPRALVLHASCLPLQMGPGMCSVNVYLSKLTIILIRVIKAMTFSKYFFLFSLSLSRVFCSSAAAEEERGYAEGSVWVHG